MHAHKTRTCSLPFPPHTNAHAYNRPTHTPPLTCAFTAGCMQYITHSHSHTPTHMRFHSTTHTLTLTHPHSHALSQHNTHTHTHTPPLTRASTAQHTLTLTHPHSHVLPQQDAWPATEPFALVTLRVCLRQGSPGHRGDRDGACLPYCWRHDGHP